MAKYSVNHIERKIILTKEFASDAKRLDSESYRILKQLRLDNPGYELAMRTIKNKNPKSACRNLNYERIRRYIIAREGAGSAIEAQFDVVIGLAKKEKGPYHHYGKEYRVSPFAMIYRDGRYLLLAIPARDTRIRTYRVDRMVNVVVSHAERHNNEIFNSLNIEDYMNGLFGINVKKLVKVKLKCHKSLVDTILDRYGMDVPISILDEEHFSVTVAVDVNAEFIGWLVSLEKRVEVLEPKNVRSKICRSCGTPIVTHADVKEDFFIFQYLRMLYARLLSKACFGDDTDALMFF